MTNIIGKIGAGNKIVGKISGITNAAVEAELTRIDERIDTIINTPMEGVSAQEIIDARQGEMSLGANITEVKSQLADNVQQINDVVNVPLGGYEEADIKATNDAVSQSTSHNSLAFGFITDTHDYINHIKAIAEISKYGQIDFLVHGGDSIATETTIDIVRQSLSNTAKTLMQVKQPVFCIRGNHDSDTNGALTIAEWSNRLIRPFKQNNIVVNPSDPNGGYYYQDFDKYKVRAIFTNSTSIELNVNVPRWGLSPTQLQWLANTALNLSSKNEDKSNWAVVVFGHMNTRQSYSNTPPVRYGGVLEQLLKAFKNGKSYINAETGVNIDFTTQGKMQLIGYIFGHTHRDVIENPNDLGFPMISTLCSLPQKVSELPPGVVFNRTVGTDTEDAWDIFIVDLENKNIATKRYGAGNNRNINYNTNYEWLVYDGFNRPNTVSPHTLGVAETGQTWINQSGEFGIVDGKAKKENGTGYDQALIDSGKANVIIDVDVTWHWGNSSGLVFRNLDNTNFIQACIDQTGLVLKKLVGGVYATLGSYAFSPVNKTTYHIKVVANGDSISVSLNGTERITATESFNNSQTKHGLRQPTSLESLYDNFTVEAIYV